MALSSEKALRFTYDEIGDVLYASLGEPRAAFSEDNNGVAIRFDISTGELVGFTIVNYSRKLRRGDLATIPFFPNVSLPDPGHFSSLT